MPFWGKTGPEVKISPRIQSSLSATFPFVAGSKHSPHTIYATCTTLLLPARLSTANTVSFPCPPSVWFRTGWLVTKLFGRKPITFSCLEPLPALPAWGFRTGPRGGLSIHSLTGSQEWLGKTVTNTPYHKASPVIRHTGNESDPGKSRPSQRKWRTIREPPSTHWRWGVQAISRSSPWVTASDKASCSWITSKGNTCQPFQALWSHQVFWHPPWAETAKGTARTPGSPISHSFSRPYWVTDSREAGMPLGTEAKVLNQPPPPLLEIQSPETAPVHSVLSGSMINVRNMPNWETPRSGLFSVLIWARGKLYQVTHKQTTLCLRHSMLSGRRKPTCKQAKKKWPFLRYFIKGHRTLCCENLPLFLPDNRQGAFLKTRVPLALPENPEVAYGRLQCSHLLTPEDTPQGDRVTLLPISPVCVSLWHLHPSANI